MTRPALAIAKPAHEADDRRADVAPAFRADHPAPAVQRLLWGKAEVREAIGVSEATFDRMLSGGKFPRPCMKIGRMPKWRPSDVAAWIDAEARKAAR